ncbi:MAG: DUF790 family protein [Halobacteriaceae archaeon]
MLTKELLEVDKHRPTIQPKYRDVDDNHRVAERVIEAYQPGKTRAEIDADLEPLETHDTFKLIRALSKLLDRRVEYQEQAPVSPRRLREAAFESGFVTSESERDGALADVADRHELTPEEVDEYLWADQEEEEVLVSQPDIDPRALLRQYNLSATQTLLFDAVELRFTISDNYQEVFGLISYLGLMYTVDDDLEITVSGPASILKQTRKYGTSMAKLVPSIMTADEWTMSAQVETEVNDETRIYEFSLDSTQRELFPEHTAEQTYDSDVERDFANRIDSLAEKWSITREPTILRTGTRVMIPDFSFERHGHEFYLEVVGFWTPEYLEEKLAKVRDVKSEHPIVLAVNESLNCTKGDFEDANVDEVFFYDERIPVKPVLDRLRAIDERMVQRDLEAIEEGNIDIPEDEVSDISAIAAREGVVPEALEAFLEANASGTISNGKYVPNEMLDAIRSEIETLDGDALSDVNRVLERYGVAQGILEDIGYSVQYVSLDQEEAVITDARE